MSENSDINSPLSTLNRTTILDKMAGETFDLIVIGGGITGAGIALDAASRGIKTALVEKTDFGWGTSSRSTKLVHGGLRYLKQFEIGLVREVGSERAIVHNIARHIVIPERMLLPIVDGGSLGKMMSSIGLWVYDWLADVPKEERRKMLSKSETSDAEPLLRTDILKGGGLYYEYRTDDARLTMEAIKTAVEHGANCINYTEVIQFVYDHSEMIIGVEVRDNKTDKIYQLKSKKVVNATGPWVDKLRMLDKGDNQIGREKKQLHLTKGVHAVVPKSKLPLKQSVYFDVLEDHRMSFAIPRGNVTYIGTTDTNYKGDTNRPVASKEDVEYIIRSTNAIFPSVNLTIEDVESTWAGLRPLIHEEGKDPSELSRKDEIFYSKSGLVSIAGGKLTGYRKMSERVVDVIAKHLGNSKGCQTEEMQLSGGKFESDEALKEYIIDRAGEVKQIGLTMVDVKNLVYRYGSNMEAIVEKAFEWHAKYSDPTERLTMAELWYVINYEMATNLNDYLIRRSGRLYFERPTLAKMYPFIADKMAEIFGWTEEEKLRDLASFKKEYEEVMEFIGG